MATNERRQKTGTPAFKDELGICGYTLKLLEMENRPNLVAELPMWTVASCTRRLERPKANLKGWSVETFHNTSVGSSDSLLRMAPPKMEVFRTIKEFSTGKQKRGGWTGGEVNLKLANGGRLVSSEVLSMEWCVLTKLVIVKKG